MNETVLQHVLEDLRHRIPVKLASEPDGGTSNARKVAGPIDTHRGDTYQFGYFLQRTDPHAILIKTRNFFEAPKSTARNAQPPQASSSKKTGAQKKQQKRPVPKQRARKRKADGTSPPATITKKRKTKGKGKARARELDNEEDEVIAISSDDEDDEEIRMVEDTEPSPNGPVRRSVRKGKQPAKGYIEIDDEDEDDGNEVPVLPDNSGTGAPEETTGTPTNQNADELDFDATGLVAMDHTAPHEHDMTIVIKSEDQPEEPFLHASTPPATIRRDSDIPPSPAEPTPSPPPPINLGSDDEEEDIKPKPILKLTYEGFNVNGKCLCVIVEPYPPLPAVRRQVSLAPVGVRAPRAPSIAPADFIPSAGAAQRARIPLFLPDWDDERERSQTPAPRRNLPRVPLFLDEPEDNEDDEELGGGMFALSQVLQTVGNNTALLAEDEDEMDGAVFFGDADEAREF